MGIMSTPAEFMFCMLVVLVYSIWKGIKEENNG
jgi:hypothetical protein